MLMGLLTSSNASAEEAEEEEQLASITFVYGAMSSRPIIFTETSVLSGESTGKLRSHEACTSTVVLVIVLVVEVVV